MFCSSASYQGIKDFVYKYRLAFGALNRRPDGSSSVSEFYNTQSIDHQYSLFIFPTALQDGNTGLVNAINLYAGAEGGSGSVSCPFTSSGSTKFFCKGECKEEDIFIKTDDVTAQSGRYSIRYKDGSSGRRSVTVTITQLTKSDSGRYRCGLGGSSAPDAYRDFDVIVIDAATLGQNTRFSRTVTVGGNITRGCLDTVYVTMKFFCKDECKKEEDILVETEENRAQNGRYSIEYTEGSAFGLYVTIIQLKKSDTGWYRCGYGRASSPDSSDTFQIFVVDGYILPSAILVPVVVVLLAVVLLLLYKLKTKRRNSDLNTRGTSDSRNMELSVSYENRPPVSMYEDSVYQSLDPDSRDLDQNYSALTVRVRMGQLLGPYLDRGPPVRVRMGQLLGPYLDRGPPVSDL
ncbi:uncharacterized protein LOC122982316 [Thunnus albacares]|uniref:uncharacterized protein LOC122982316 n=1 Tax=Thunnus albacares TaxID=8236 RepID=UPI001CF6E7F8|nr:uncharacterized protein LOC122982316 [Thunnus albacares]